VCKTIMVPTDGSGFDRKAILVALRVAERSGARVRLVRAVTSGDYLGTEATDGMDSARVLRAEHRQALSELDALAAECRSISNTEISVDLEEGPAADVLERYAKRNEIDLIVISSHGRRGLARLSLGSVTDSLIRGTTIPVLVVKPNASYLAPDASQEFRRIIVPLDGSSLAERILSVVVPLARLESAEVTLLHVLAPLEDWYEDGDTRSLPWWKKKVAGARAYLSRWAIHVRLQGVATKIDVVAGDKAADAITDYARRENADLIAIATHGRGGLTRVMRGSVADEVIKSASCSLLVLHPEKAIDILLSGKSIEGSPEETATLA
jgi:nucleotide-binding universal stress UspA family protein